MVGDSQEGSKCYFDRAARGKALDLNKKYIGRMSVSVLFHSTCPRHLRYHLRPLLSNGDANSDGTNAHVFEKRLRELGPQTHVLYFVA